MTDYIFHLGQISLSNSRDVGMKAVRLAELHRKGLRIPDAYALTAGLLNDVYWTDSLKNLQAQKIQDQILQLDFPENIRDGIRNVWEELSSGGKYPIIVRSSGIDEDSDNTSCAGIYESFLNIRTYSDAELAVKKCWASYFSDHAIKYRKDNEINFNGIGVILQVMVEGESSGVFFTVNPISLNKEELAIEACKGLNIGVVDGAAATDYFLINRRGEVQEDRIGKKTLKYTAGKRSFDIEVDTISKNQWYEPVLTKQKIKELTNTALEIERIYEMPCDIEWTIKGEDIYILQTRPVSRYAKEEKASDILYDDNIEDHLECSLLDRFSEAATVCYLSLLQCWQSNVYLSFYNKHKGSFFKEKPLVFLFNRVYWNFKFQRENYDNVPFKKKGLMNLYKKLKIIRLMLLGYKNWYRRLNKYDRLIINFSDFNLTKMSISELRLKLQNVIDVFCNYIGRDHYQFLGLAQVCYNLLDSELSDMPERKKIIDLVKSAEAKNITVNVNKELFELAELAHSDSGTLQLFLHKSADQIYGELVLNSIYGLFKDKFDSFIQKHGHRGTGCDDLYYPHWVEEPSYVIEIIKQYLIINSKENVLKKDNAEENSNYREKVLEYSKQLNKSKFKQYIKYRKVLWLIRLTAEYMALRENQRYYFDKSWVLIRKIMLEIGERLKTKHIIPDKNDIFHLTIDEIYSVCDMGSNDCEKDYKRITALRKKTYEKNMKITPPYLIKSMDLYRLQKSGGKKSYKAVGISPGKAIGKVRMVGSVKDLGNVEQGDILVVSSFHPSWTPVLSVVSGIIMNYGNILSHGAVVAREYKVPVVVFNDVATKMLTEGQWLEIDGTNGRIRVVETGEAAQYV
ncbi:PEP/pyruvate-binding domain-containing protein [Ruminiclostridium cellobioparum]|jgi:phosphohistidine swiveling domain-containing protein|uniref:PEP/pyruvate-binding domain-containing protein n=1 Tax=Ruminiclostridium cellobioparum TaxID=29355 RepID=UPI0028AF16CE|nr:PEP/pyruvate-binding domain-containing protein [Ruminiclostridium cellobioparum]